MEEAAAIEVRVFLSFIKYLMTLFYFFSKPHTVFEKKEASLSQSV